MKTRILGFGPETLVQIIFQLFALIILIGIIVLVVYCLILLIKVLKKKSKALDLEISKRESDNESKGNQKQG